MKFKLIVGGSFISCVLIIGAALFSTPYMVRSLHNETAEAPIEMLGSYLMFAFFLGFPWLLIFKLPLEQNNRKIAFSIASALLAVLFYKPISGGQDFSIGLNIIFYLICIGMLFPISKLVK